MTAPRFLISIPKAAERQAPYGVKRVSELQDVLQRCPCLWSNVDIALQSLPPDITIAGRIMAKHDILTQGRGSSFNGTNREPAWASALFEKFWGSYIAIRVDSAASSIELARDPSGALPLYRAESESHHLFGSDLAALEASGAVTNSVNWGCLYEHLTAPEIRRAQTCLNGVTEVAPGGILRVDSDGITEQLLWSPWDYIDRSDGDFCSVDAALLREIVCQSVSAWAEPFDHILVGTSGGLDSSVVCAALASRGHRFTCLTLATSDPSGDERRYAMAVAEATGAQLRTFIYDPTLIDVRRSSSAHLPRPVGKPFMQELERAYHETISRDFNSAIFTGNGGDNVFCFLHSAAPIIDRLRSEGSLRNTTRTLLDMCRITECDIFSMTKAAFRLFYSTAQPPKPDLRLLNPGRPVIPPTRQLTPYLDRAPLRKPGKVIHVDLLTKIQNFVEGLDRAAFPWVTAPLLCQPIVEACLAVPSWQWVEHGINRSLAREAFRGLLPASITARISKAGPDSVMAAVFQRNRSILRDLLLSGLLRKHGLIDVDAVEAALASPETMRSQIFHRLLVLGEAEAWARSRSQ